MTAVAQKTVLSVSELNRQARITIEERFHQVWVMGEMSNFVKPRSGHWYFSLKDEQAQVRCAMFVNRNRAVRMQPGDGQLVMVRGRVSLYEGRGEFQVIVDHMEPAGAGALRQAYDQLKAKLADEGLFDATRKQPLPPYPRRCVVVTSPTGAAFKDVLAVWQRRYPALEVILVPSAVQGADAEAQLIEAIARAGRIPADVLLLTRGGGSLEDLWSFNLEGVARALAACPLPSVCAVGHEIDVSICDFVADVRAPTPSAAAELIVPDARHLMAQFGALQRDLINTWQRLHQLLQLTVRNLSLQVASPRTVLEQASQRLDDLSGRLQRRQQHRLEVLVLKLTALNRQLRAHGPTERLQATSDQLAQLKLRLRATATSGLERQQQRLETLSRMLHGVSPLPTLARGYALVTDAEGEVVSDTRELSTGDVIKTYFNEGAITSRVADVDPNASLENRKST